MIESGHIWKRYKDYNEADKELMREKKMLYYVANKSVIQIRAKRYTANNKAKVLALKAKRRADKPRATPAWVDLNKIKAIYSCCKQLSELTGVEHHVDHVVPLQGKNVCGLHVHYNLQILKASENISKSNKLLLS
jgi:5-methylcytosine-specific restriction endonuclease McrA